MIHQEIAVLRGMDKAQTLVEQLLHQQQTNTPQIFSQAVMEGLHQLLEVCTLHLTFFTNLHLIQKADNLTTKPQVKFMARTIYICLTLHAQDMFDCQTALDSIIKSSLLLAYEVPLYPSRPRKIRKTTASSSSMAQILNKIFIPSQPKTWRWSPKSTKF